MLGILKFYRTQILNIFKRKRITFTFYENPFVRSYSWWTVLLLICLSVFSFKEVCRSKVIGSLLSRAWWHLGRHQLMVGFFCGSFYNARFIMAYNFCLICTLTPQISIYFFLSLPLYKFHHIIFSGKCSTNTRSARTGIKRIYFR